VRVVVFGDSIGFTLAYSLGVGSLPSKLHYSLKNEAHIGCGLPDSTPLRFKGVVTDPGSVCNDTKTPTPNAPFTSQPLPVQWETALAKYRPNVVVFLAGRWQVTDRLYDGAWTNILNPTFAANVKQQLESASDLFTSTGADVVFLTTPCVDETPPQPDGQPWPESDPARIAAYNALVRQVATEYPTTDSVVDLNALVCPGGKYTANFQGVTIRTSDGIHFTAQSGVALGRALMPSILSAGREHPARAHASSTGAATRPSG
jgi:SGNH domain (fused to AT3 domains)